MPSVVTRLIGLDAVFRPDCKALLALSSSGAVCRSVDHDLGWNAPPHAIPTCIATLGGSGGSSIVSLQKAAKAAKAAS